MSNMRRGKGWPTARTIQEKEKEDQQHDEHE